MSDIQQLPEISTATRIGWIGTGVMGFHMCRHLLENSYPVTVYTRTRSKAAPLLALGAVGANSVREVAEKCDVIFTIVGFPADVREVYLNDNGILAAAKPHTIAIDMTTTEPSLARKIYDMARSKPIYTVDAPVSGGDVGARNGTLSIMVGGDRDVVEAVQPLLKILGRTIVYQGEAGAGQHTKMCNQITIAGTMIGVCESLLYGYRAGLNLNTMLTSISGGAAACWTLDNLAPRILQRNFDPGFFVDHFVKDMGIALREAQRMNLALPGLALVHQLYTAVQAQGHGQKGTHALMLALERISNVNQ